MYKLYVKPTARIKEIQVAMMISLSIVDGEADPDKPALDNQHRGKWGDLWGDDAESSLI